MAPVPTEASTELAGAAMERHETDAASSAAPVASASLLRTAATDAELGRPSIRSPRTLQDPDGWAGLGRGLDRPSSPVTEVLEEAEGEGSEFFNGGLYAALPLALPADQDGMLVPHGET